LHLSLFDGPRAINDLVGPAALFLNGHLGSDAELRVLRRKAAFLEALDLLIGTAPADNDAVELFVEARFENQGCFDDGEFRATGTIERLEPISDNIEDTRVKDLVEAGALLGVGENDCAELRAVHLGEGIENFFAEFEDDFVVGGLALLEEFVAQGIGLQERAIEIAQNVCHGGFAGSDSAGETDFKHGKEFSCADGGSGRGARAAAETRGADRVAHKHRDSQRADASGHGSECARGVDDVGMNVADQDGALGAE
jgi:hypothetical protein